MYRGGWVREGLESSIFFALAGGCELAHGRGLSLGFVALVSFELSGLQYLQPAPLHLLHLSPGILLTSAKYDMYIKGWILLDGCVHTKPV